MLSKNVLPARAAGPSFEVDPLERGLLGGVALLLIAVAFRATAIPALRALRVQPMIALRNE